MSRIRLVLTAVAIPILFAGCALTPRDQIPRGGMNTGLSECILVGSAAGAGAGTAISGEAAGAAVGAAVGALIGAFYCEPADMLAMAEPVDTDGDGVLDDSDECPGTPAGVAVGANGCPLDSDGDGVPDFLDKCPGTPAGVNVDHEGCALDSDGDGVANYLDKCPGTPAGVEVDTAGCPKPGQVMLRLEGVNFDFDKATIRPDARPILDEAATALKASPSVRVRIEGHTDSIGSARYNEGLSLRRAKSVRDYLVSKGVSITRLSVIGKGESEPIASNETREGRARNRRVDFVTR